MKHIDGTVLEAVYNGDGDAPEHIFDPEDESTPIARVFWNGNGWRGHYDTELLDGVTGWKHVDEGANTGAWEDAPAGTSNAEVEDQIEKLEAEHGTILVVGLPTSNVFSTAFDVYAKVAAT